MQNHLKKFLLKSAIFSGIILIIGAIIFTLVLKEYYLPIFPVVLVYFIFVTFIVHMILLKANTKRTAQFVPYFMLSMFIKLMLHLMFIVIYVVIDKQNAVPFLITFLICYFLFSIFAKFRVFKINF